LQPVGGSLEKIVVDSLRRVPKDQAPLLAWPLVCGSAVAERTRATNFADGILQVEVADAGWQRELQGLAPRYLATINQYIGQPVRRIEFVIASRAGTAGRIH
jgi:predicted nucleic acid-binding Zn ribbon protein